MSINPDTLLTSAGGRNIAEQILDKEFLKNVKITGSLYQKTKGYALAKPMPTKEGFYFRMSRKDNIRQPETDPMTNGQSTDPAGPVTLGMNQVLLPIDSHRMYAEIDVMTPLISWVNVEDWVKMDIGQRAWPRYANRQLQAALLNGRMAPGVFAANGTVSTPFWRTAQVSLERYGVQFTFTKFPRAYARGLAAFADVKPDSYLTWADIGTNNVRLSNSGAPMIEGSEGKGYVCACSRAQWYDLMEDDDNGKLKALVQGGHKATIDGIVGNAVFFYRDTYFVIEEDPYTLNAGNEVARAEWGKYHVAFMFGQEAYAHTTLGSSKSMTNFKITDTSKTGTGYSIGTRIHWNCRVVNENWGVSIISAVRIDKPNNYSPTNKQTNGVIIE